MEPFERPLPKVVEGSTVARDRVNCWRPFEWMKWSKCSINAISWRASDFAARAVEREQMWNGLFERAGGWATGRSFQEEIRERRCWMETRRSRRVS
jgi:hypothetical protein